MSHFIPPIAPKSVASPIAPTTIAKPSIKSWTKPLCAKWDSWSTALPFVVPTNYVRVGDKLFLHGSPASRLMKTLASGAPFCLSVTLLDGIVFAPSAMGHSVNYRSVVVMGKAEVIEGHEAKLAAMRDFVEHVIHGRWAQVRPPSENDLKATMVLAVPLVEASAKVRTGFAVDDIEEYNAPPGQASCP